MQVRRADKQDKVEGGAKGRAKLEEQIARLKKMIEDNDRNKESLQNKVEFLEHQREDLIGDF